MADTKRSLSALQTLFADNLVGNISAQDLRDFLVSIYGSAYSVTVGSSTYSVLDDDVMIELNAASNNIDVTLPTGVGYNDRMLLFKRTDATANTVTITRGGTDTIEGNTSITLNYQYAGLILFKKGTVWLKTAIDGAVFDKVVDTLDNINNGSSYGKVLLTELSSGQVQRVRAVTNAQNVTGDQIYEQFTKQDAIYTDLEEPTGFVSRAETTISFVDGSRTFTIAPTGANFSYYIKGTKYTKTLSEQIVIGTATGLHYLYYNAAALSEATVWTDDFFSDYALVAIIYWTGTQAIVVGDERHGAVMPWSTHKYLHTTVGTVWQTGLDIGGYVLSTDSDAAITFGFTNGIVSDEDINISIVNGTPGNNFEMDLVDPAQLPVMYKTGNVVWTEDTPTDYAYKAAGTGRLALNVFTGGAWQQLEITNNNYMAYWVVATNDIQYPLKSIQGSVQYANQNDAISGAGTELINFGDLPAKEIKILYRIVLRSSNSYTDARKCIIVAVQDFRKSSFSTSASPSIVSHALLQNLDYATAGHTGFGRLAYTTTTNPTVNNDGVDTAGIGRQFRVGDYWINTTAGTWWVCVNNTTGAAVWVFGKASQVTTDVTNFNQVLTSADDTTQKALDKLDDYSYDEYYEDETLFSTTSGTYVEAATFTTSSLQAGNYLITCLMEGGPAQKDKIGFFRFQVDNTTNIIETTTGRTADAPLYMVWTAFRRLALGAGTHTIDLDVYTDNTFNVRSMRVHIKRVK